MIAILITNFTTRVHLSNSETHWENPSIALEYHNRSERSNISNHTHFAKTSNQMFLLNSLRGQNYSISATWGPNSAAFNSREESFLLYRMYHLHWVWQLRISSNWSANQWLQTRTTAHVVASLLSGQATPYVAARRSLQSQIKDKRLRQTIFSSRMARIFLFQGSQRLARRKNLRGTRVWRLSPQRSWRRL